MNYDLTPILESKRVERRRLAARPIGEKLRMLDDLRDRQISLREAGERIRGSGPAVPSVETPVRLSDGESQKDEG